MRFHIHWPRHQEFHWPYMYQTCRCGARRTRWIRTTVRFHAPTMGPEWWLPRDGWHKHCTCSRDADRTYVDRDPACPLRREHEKGRA